jgi:hypothetical protein
MHTADVSQALELRVHPVRRLEIDHEVRAGR